MPNQTVKWLPLKPSSNYWGLNFNNRIGIKKHGKIAGVIESTSTVAILDSGSSYILIPSADFYQYVTHVYKTLNLVFKRASPRTTLTKAKCNADQARQMPDLVIKLDNQQFTIPSRSFVVPMKTKTGDTSCYLLLNPRDFGGSWRKKTVEMPDGSFSSQTTGGMWVLGNIFLNSYYAIYDLDQQRIGLVPSKGSTVTEDYNELLEFNTIQAVESENDSVRMTLIIIVAALFMFAAMKLCSGNKN